MIDVNFYEETARIEFEEIWTIVDYDDLHSLYRQLKDYYTEQGKG